MCVCVCGGGGGGVGPFREVLHTEVSYWASVSKSHTSVFNLCVHAFYILHNYIHDPIQHSHRIHMIQF